MDTTPLQIDGWEDISTGGGCNALAKELPNGLYWLMTDGDNQSPTRMDQGAYIQLQEDGYGVLDDGHWCDTVADALKIADAYIVPAEDAPKVALLQAKKQVAANHYPTVVDGQIVWVQA